MNKKTNKEEELKKEELKKKWKKQRYWIAGLFWVLPIIVFLIIYFFGGYCVFMKEWFQILFPMLAGCWGLTMRAIEFGDYSSSPFPKYITLYPLAVIMNGFVIFTFLSLFKLTSSFLFFTAALPLGMFMGFHAHPGFWIIGKLIDKWAKTKS